MSGRRRFWFDPRFAVGIVLIAASVVGTSVVVSAADASVEVLAARDTLTPGQRVSSGDLLVTRVGLEAAEDLYLTPDQIDDGVVVTRTIAAGELVPSAAVGSTEGLDVTTLVVDVDGPIATTIDSGAVVDVWAAAESTEGGYESPVVIVPDATVVALVTPEGLVVGDDAGSVELLVPTDTVARLLEAIADDEALSLVPTSVPLQD